MMMPGQRRGHGLSLNPVSGSASGEGSCGYKPNPVVKTREKETVMRTLLIAAFALLLAGPVAAQDVYRASAGATAPKITETAKPMYGLWVMSKGGVVGLEVDVKPDGTAGTVALIESAGAELDQVASEVAKRFKFSPGTKDGKPVAVRITMRLEFNTRSSGRPPMRLLEPQPN